MGSGRGGYDGSSFSELLQIDYPHLAVDLGRCGNFEHLNVPHGTTVLAFEEADGVIVAGDRLASEVLPVASRDVPKVYANDHDSINVITQASVLTIRTA